MNNIHNDITSFFEEALMDLECHRDTKAYIVSIFGKYKSSDLDLSKHSITTLFAEARYKHSFREYQNLADWLFYINTIAPGHLKYASKDYYDSIGKLSYYSCYKIINKEWKLFEELADRFVDLELQVQSKLNKIII